MDKMNERIIRELVFKRVTGFYAPGVDIPAALGYDAFNLKYCNVIEKTIQAYEEVMDV